MVEVKTLPYLHDVYEGVYGVVFMFKIPVRSFTDTIELKKTLAETVKAKYHKLTLIAVSKIPRNLLVFIEDPELKPADDTLKFKLDS